MTPDQHPPAPEGTLAEVARVFLRLGATAFGGPAAHIAMMEEEVVGRRGWVTREEFLDLLGATNLIPGPNSTEMAIHLGRLRAGWAGLVVAGACFIVPAAVMVAALAWAYVRFHALPAGQAILYGAKPVVIAVVCQALWRLTRTAVRTAFLGVVTVAATAASFVGADELAVLVLAGACVASWHRLRARGPIALTGFATTGSTAVGVAAGAGAFSLGALFLILLKIGAVLYGSGYVLLAFLRADLVEHRHWLTQSQLLDSIAVGQITPGPVFTTATFIGYLLGGFPGAAVATLGIFLPSFVLVAASGPLVSRLRRSQTAGAFLDGVNAASLALMLVVTWSLARSALVDPPTALLAVASLLALQKVRVNSAWIVLAGGLAGALIHALR